MCEIGRFGIMDLRPLGIPGVVNQPGNWKDLFLPIGPLSLHIHPMPGRVSDDAPTLEPKLLLRSNGVFGCRAIERLILIYKHMTPPVIIPLPNSPNSFYAHGIGTVSECDFGVSV